MFFGDKGGKKSVVSTISFIIAMTLITKIKLDKGMSKICQT